MYSYTLKMISIMFQALAFELRFMQRLLLQTTLNTHYVRSYSTVKGDVV